MRNVIQKLLADRRGATAIEYGLIAAVMAVLVVAAFQLLGDELNTLFGSIFDVSP